MSNRIFDNPYHNMTLVHNALFDEVMPTLSSDGWKVLCATLRQTWGWGRNVNRLDRAFFVKQTGIEDPARVDQALAECVAIGYIQQRKIGQAVIYILNTEFLQEAIPADIPAPASATPPPKAVSSEPPAVSTEHAQAIQLLQDFAQEMGADPDTAQLEAIAVKNNINDIRSWIELGRAMTHLRESARFTIVQERLLASVPPLPLSMLAPEIAETIAVEQVEVDDEAPATVSAPEASSSEMGEQSAEELWETVLEELQTKMRRSKFRFLKPTQGIALTDSKLTVTAPNKRTKEWLETGQLADVIQETFRQATYGRYELEFVVE